MNKDERKKDKERKIESNFSFSLSINCTHHSRNSSLHNGGLWEGGGKRGKRKIKMKIERKKDERKKDEEAESNLSFSSSINWLPLTLAIAPP